MIITIDGPAGSGKSTIAQQLAQQLNFTFFDTGAMYRAVTHGFLAHDISCDDASAVEDFLHAFHLEIHTIDGEKHYFSEGNDITKAIRRPEVTAYVSPVSALPAVRNKLVSLQRTLAKGVDAVFEGRDMGSVVFPHADLKVFLIATPAVRAKRRLEQMQEKGLAGPEDTVEAIQQQIEQRDAADSSRSHSPLIRPANAHEIDTSDLTLDQVLKAILTLIQT